MADDDHSLLLLEFLDTIEIRSHRVVLERVHPFEELNKKKFCGHFRLSKRATLHILSEARRITQSTNNCSSRTTRLPCRPTIQITYENVKS